MLYWQDNTIANYRYYMANQSKFVDGKGNPAKFGDVFKSQRQIYNEIGTSALYEIMDVFAKGGFESGDVTDHFINVEWRSSYAPLFPGYVQPVDITAPYKRYRFVTPGESP